MLKKVLSLRTFQDENGHTNLALEDIGGEVLSVSQFTLYGDVKTPPQEKDYRVRTTIYGRPCVMFHRTDASSNPEFYGKFNGNVDKGGT